MGKHSNLIAMAFERVRKRGIPEIGSIVGVMDKRFPLSYELVGIEDNQAICELPDGMQQRFPLEDIADVNEVKSVALNIHLRGQVEAARVYHKQFAATQVN